MTTCYTETVDVLRSKLTSTMESKYTYSKETQHPYYVICNNPSKNKHILIVFL